MGDAQTAYLTASGADKIVASAASEIPTTDGVNGTHVETVPQTGALSERRLKVIQIGAGVTGIETAHFIQSMPNIDLTIYDKNPDLGGTWYENRYPGCACDVPAHSYSFNWAPNPNWSRWIVTSPEIHQYLTGVVKKHDLCKYMRLSHKITAAKWDDESGKWVLSIERQVDGKSESFQDECDFLISGTGVLNNWKWPDIAGIHSFNGKLLHTASWDQKYDFSGKRVAVIGNGASAVQVVPEIRKGMFYLTEGPDLISTPLRQLTYRKVAARVDVYMRSPTWLTPTPWLANGITADKIYTDEEKARFADDPEYFLQYRKDIDDRVNSGWSMFYKGSEAQKFVRSEILERYRHIIDDPEVRQFLSPDFGVGCRRPTPADGFLASLREKNVSVILKAATQIIAPGIVEGDKVNEYDAIVCATGFDTSYVPRFPIIGRNGKNLQDIWRASLEAYLGLTVAGFPNYFTYAGPLSPIANGSAFPGTAMQSAYLSQILSKVQKENIKSLDVKKSVQDQYNEWAQSRMEDIVWTSGCRSWYQDEHGKVRVPYPGSLLHYRKMTERPLFEHFDFEYRDQNAFAWLGNGRTKEELDGTVSDWSPYIYEVGDKAHK